MKFVNQELTLPIQNFDNMCELKSFRRHSDLFGGNCKRAIVVGSSGTGKTNILLTLLTHPNGLRFQNLYLCSKTLSQSKYNYLRYLMKPMTDFFYYECSEIENMVTPCTVKEYSIVIFDDVQCTPQNIIKEFFSFGRHKNVDCFYLCQSYGAVPKHLLRDNCNLIVTFRQDMTNLKHIYDDYVSADMTFDQFQEMCRACWSDPYGFLVVDLDCVKNKGRYRRGFDTYIQH